MSNTLNMAWNNSSTDSFNFVVTKVKHGDTPTAPPLSSNGAATVVAKQSTNITPGPEGTYLWQSQDLQEQVTCDYHFPAGSSGQLIQITLSPSKGLQVSFDGTNWTSDKLPKSWTSTSTTFTASCYIRDTPKS